LFIPSHLSSNKRIRWLAIYTRTLRHPSAMVLGGKWSSTRSILVSSMNIHQRDSLTRVHARSKQSISRIAIIKLTASEVCRFSNGVTEHRFEILTMETPMTLKSSLSIGQSHWKWSRWVSRGWFPMVTDISLKLYVGVTRAMPKSRPSEVLPCEWCARTSQTDGRWQTADRIAMTMAELTMERLAKNHSL